MGRPERPLNPQDGPIAQLAWELRQLRERAGRPSYRELARRAHYSVTTLADAARGERLPTLETTLAYAGACGGDRAEWETRWRSAAVLRISKTRVTRDFTREERETYLRPPEDE